MPLKVNWALTYMCNYHCSYCFDTNDKRIIKSNFSSLEQLELALDNIIQLNRPYYDFTFVGGEPTIHPNLIELIHKIKDRLKNKTNSILIITNGSQNTSFYSKLLEFSNDLPISLLFSIHTDHVKLNDLIEKIKLLKRNIKINFNLMFNPAKREYVKEIYKELFNLREEYFFNLNIGTLREGPDYSVIDSRYTPEDFTWQSKANSDFEELAKKSDIKLSMPSSTFPASKIIASIEKEGKIVNIPFDNRIEHGTLNFNGLYCVSGSHVLIIKPNGMAEGLICSQATKSDISIYEKNPYLNEAFISYVQCNKPNCGCQTNHALPKFADEKEAEEFVKIVRLKQQTLMPDVLIKKSKAAKKNFV